MNKSLAELIRISNATGSDTTLVQGGGGNTSVKTDDGKYMYIKASGTALKDMNGKNGWRRLRLDSVPVIISDQAITKLDAQKRELEVVNRLLLTCDDNVTSGARPSVEAHLHAFLDKYVIHLHPNAVGAYVNCKVGKAKIDKLFKDEKLPILWVSYTDPGFMLAKKIAKLIDDYKKQYGEKPAILFLQKHGLIVSANKADTALRLVRKVVKRCSGNLKQLKVARAKSVSHKVVADAQLCIRRAFFKATGRYVSVNYFYDKAFEAFWRRRNAKKVLAAAALAPDELVYSNGPAVWLDKCDSDKIAGKLTSQVTTGQKPSLAFLVKGVGLFVAANEKVAGIIKDLVKTSLFIRTNAERLGGIVGLNKRQRDFINKWEAESFRAKLATDASEGV